MATPDEIKTALDDLTLEIANAGGIQEIRDGSKSERHYSIYELLELQKASEARAAAAAGGFWPGQPLGY